MRSPIPDFPISIHALRVEGDRITVAVGTGESDFYPRPPGGGRLLRLLLSSCTAYFYPRPPGGGRLLHAVASLRAEAFLSTPSGWRATITSFRIVLY